MGGAYYWRELCASKMAWLISGRDRRILRLEYCARRVGEFNLQILSACSQGTQYHKDNDRTYDRTLILSRFLQRNLLDCFLPSVWHNVVLNKPVVVVRTVSDCCLRTRWNNTVACVRT